MTKSGMTLTEKFYADCKNDDLNFIIETTKSVKWFKDMYVKHAFDESGKVYKSLYELESDLLKHLKLSYKEKYEIRNS